MADTMATAFLCQLIKAVNQEHDSNCKNWHFVQLITWTIEVDGVDNHIMAF